MIHLQQDTLKEKNNSVIILNHCTLTLLVKKSTNKNKFSLRWSDLHERLKRMHFLSKLK
jgi:hypothetical protein